MHGGRVHCHIIAVASRIYSPQRRALKTKWLHCHSWVSWHRHAQELNASVLWLRYKLKVSVRNAFAVINLWHAQCHNQHDKWNLSTMVYKRFREYDVISYQAPSYYIVLLFANNQIMTMTCIYVMRSHEWFPRRGVIILLAVLFFRNTYVIISVRRWIY